MSASSNPFGLKPAYHTSGLDRATPFTGTISTANNLYQYSAVALNATGQLINAGADPTATNIYGVVDGFEFTDATGRRTVSKWFGAGVGTVTDSVAWVWTDPQLIYEVQADGPVNAASVGRQFNLVNPTAGEIIGNGGLGQSTAGLDSTGPTAAGTQGQLIVTGLGREVNNEWGDAYTIVQVKVADSKLTAPVPSTAD